MTGGAAGSEPVTAAIIEARDLVKRFDGFTAVDHISFAVPEGVIFGFFGPNGAGKTTTIKMLTTVLSPSERRLSIVGVAPTSDPVKNHVNKTNFLLRFFQRR
jgi:ABC-type multidrug transport system ATPase subunit